MDVAQSAGAAEYTDCTSVEEQDPTNDWHGYDTKQSDSGILVTLELWGMRNTPSLPSIPSPLRPGVVVPDRVQVMG